MSGRRMKILHYSLGFSPYRTGGLTKYCIDLMLTQNEQGFETALLWPGRIRILCKAVRIYEHRKWNGVGSYEIINPLPVALDEGIADVQAYRTSTDDSSYRDFLLNYNPDVVYVHTLMGLHLEFLTICKELDIRTVFISHDYYGVCPKVTLFRDGHPCDNDHDCYDCIKCNQTAMSLKKIMVMQSLFYRIFKDTVIMKKLRGRHRKVFFEMQPPDKVQKVTEDKQRSEYQKLRNYYVTMLEKMDFIHFNSTVAEKIYRRYFEPKNSGVRAITHRDIADHRKIKDFDHDRVRLAYLGTARPYKGFFFLLSVLDDIWECGNRNFELSIYTATSEKRPYMISVQERYTYSQLEKIFDNTDLLIVPSLWYETFGFNVLEALSYGVPVLVSRNVGAKDLVSDNFIYDDLREKMLEIIGERKILAIENQKIVSSEIIKSVIGKAR